MSACMDIKRLLINIHSLILIKFFMQVVLKSSVSVIIESPLMSSELKLNGGIFAVFRQRY